MRMKLAFVIVLVAFSTLAVGAQAQTCGASLCPGDDLNAAYQSAPAGVETVFTLGSGDYGDQTIDDEPSKETAGVGPHVVFEPAPGAVLTGGNLRLGVNVEDNRGPDHLTVRGFDLRGELFVGGNDVNDVTVRDVSAQSFYVNGVQNFLLEGNPFTCSSDFDPRPDGAPNTPNSKIDRGPGVNDNVVVDGVCVHNYTFTSACQGYGGSFDCHGEGLIIFGGRNVVVRNSRFWDNWIYDVFWQWDSAVYPQFSLTLENNWFGDVTDGRGATRQTAATNGTSRMANLLVRYNSFVQGQRLVDENGATFTNSRAIGNIFGLSTGNNACIAGIAYSYNIWLGGAAGCNATERVVGSLSYVNPSGDANQDYHLTGGAAVGLVTSTSADASLAADIDGQVRSAPRDAGSDETGAPPPPPPLPQCSDGLDNDGDGHIDYPADLGCVDVADNDETDPPPPPPPPPTCTAPSLSSGPQTDKTSTVLWASVLNATGYKIYKNGVLVSTAGPLTTSTKYGNLSYGLTSLGVAAICPDGDKLSPATTIENRVLTVP